MNDTNETAVADLWAEYRATGAEELRNRLVVHHSGLVKFVAGRVRAGLSSHVDQADLVSDGVLGLIDAVERFEPERGVQFQTFAVPRIRGAIMDGLRALDWVPKSIRTRAKEIAFAQASLEGRLGRAVEAEELAAEVGLSVAELREVHVPLAFAGVPDLEGLGLVDETSLEAVELAEDEETRRLLRRAIRLLAERDQVVLALYYFERLTLAEIGAVLGVTESRVSQVHAGATVALRAHLAELEVA